MFKKSTNYSFFFDFEFDLKLKIASIGISKASVDGIATKNDIAKSPKKFCMAVIVLIRYGGVIMLVVIITTEK